VGFVATYHRRDRLPQSDVDWAEHREAQHWAFQTKTPMLGFISFSPTYRAVNFTDADLKKGTISNRHCAVSEKLKHLVQCATLIAPYAGLARGAPSIVFFFVGIPHRKLGPHFLMSLIHAIFEV